MTWCRCLPVLLVAAISLRLSCRIVASEIKLFSLKDVAAKWLADEGAKDASAHFDGALAEIFLSDKKLTAALRFEKAILDGQPLDPDKHALHIALNYLRASNM